MKDLSRVFFHEFGHFVAHELSYLHFNGHQTLTINLFHHPQNDQIWEGEARLDVPASEQSSYIPTVEYLAVYLATSTYGCLFQSYFLKTGLEECFKTNGKNDARQWLGILQHYNLAEVNSVIADWERAYFNRLESSGALDRFMEIEPSDYLLAAGTAYYVDIKKLRSAVEHLVAEHADLFMELVSGYQKIIDQTVQSPDTDAD